MTKQTRTVALILIDALLILIAVYASYLLRFDFSIGSSYTDAFPYVMTLYVVVVLASFYSFKLYKRIWQYASVGDLISIFKASFIGSTIVYVMDELFHYIFAVNVVIPRSIHILSIMTIFLIVGGSRFVWRLFRDNYMKLQPYHQRALIVGAGEAGVVVVRELKHSQSDYYPVAFIDDNHQKQNLELMGIPVVGTRDDILKAIKKYEVNIIIIALPSASKDTVSEIINICKQTNCQIKIIPRVKDLINGNISIKEIRDVSVEDLLGREPINVDIEEISDYLTDQIVMVTGAGGSIGSEICRQVSSIAPNRLVLLDHSENNIYDIELELKQTFPTLNLVPVIADVQDKLRLEDVFNAYQPDVVFHAAAQVFNDVNTGLMLSLSS